MITADLAIFISIFSVLLAAMSLGWNIYRDVVLKPKVIVTFAVKNIVNHGIGVSPDYVGITATNRGPGSVILNTLVLRESSFWKKLTKNQRYAVLIGNCYIRPYSSEMPKKLQVGESLNLFIRYDQKCFLKESFTQLGIDDSFGRINWAPKGVMKKIREKWVHTFAKNT